MKAFSGDWPGWLCFVVLVAAVVLLLYVTLGGFVPQPVNGSVSTQPSMVPIEVITRVESLYAHMFRAILAFLALVAAIIGGLQIWQRISFKQQEIKARKELDELRSNAEGLRQDISETSRVLVSVCHTMGVMFYKEKKTGQSLTALFRGVDTALQQNMGESELEPVLASLVRTCEMPNINVHEIIRDSPLLRPWFLGLIKKLEEANLAGRCAERVAFLVALRERVVKVPEPG